MEDKMPSRSQTGKTLPGMHDTQKDLINLLRLSAVLLRNQYTPYRLSPLATCYTDLHHS